MNKNMTESREKRESELKKFADNLRYLIADSSVLHISKQIGIPQQTLQRYLHCQREIGLHNLIKIADYFDEDLDIIVGRKT